MQNISSKLALALTVVVTLVLALPAGASPITPTPESLAIELPLPAAPETCDDCNRDVQNPTFLWSWHDLPQPIEGSTRVTSSLVSLDQVPEPSVLLLLAFAGTFAGRRLRLWTA